ncbi:MAG: 50S ribosomal protein L7/L12 [Mycoplasmataceae bacterium]|jgi:large subunit ribosomal protein L7/L12|nr:50S ribosomal protein L7/L12 [Mycoplasmataceae bacterium]
MAKLTNEQIITSLKESTLVEINELINAIQTEFGVSAAAPVAASAGEATTAAPTSVTATLVETGVNKIAIIKLYREATGLGLIESKTAVEKGNVIIKENIKPEEAAEIKKNFEAQGAKVKVE